MVTDLRSPEIIIFDLDSGANVRTLSGGGGGHLDGVEDAKYGNIYQFSMFQLLNMLSHFS